MPQLVIHGETFNVEVSGPDHAPPLMLSNSLGTNLHMWDGQMAALTQAYRVIRYDSRGHGRSVVSNGPYAIAQLGQDALHIMDALNLTKVRWCGLSKGGMVGMWLLTHGGHRIERAVLANTSPRMGPPHNWNTRLKAVSTMGMAGIRQGVIDRWFTPEFQASSPEAVARVAAMIETTPAAGYAACCSAIRDMDQREALRRVTLPTLVIVGTRDPATPPDHGEMIRDAIPDAALVRLEAAHLSNIERPALFTRAMMDFLA